MNDEVSQKVDAAVALASNVSATQYERIPPEAVTTTKRIILDSLGIVVAGTTAFSSDWLVDMVKDWGGKEESTIVCYKAKVPSMNAALANSTMARALDFTVNPAIVVPAAFAVAEKRGRVSGKELITAVTLGMDMFGRLMGAPRISPGWSEQSTMGYFTAAATAGKLLGLNEEKLVEAFGIAYQQSGGNHQAMIDGALSKRLSTGFASRGGILAALLAEKGFTGGRNSLEGNWGLYNLYYGGNYDPTALTDDLGKRFEVNTLMKIYPCCAHTHTFIDAVLSLVSEHDITPEQVKTVRAGINTVGYNMCCRPIELKRRPTDIVDAQFSAPYEIATAIVDRKVIIGSFTKEAIRRPQVLELTQKIEPYIESDLDKTFPVGVGPGRLEMTLTSGEVYTRQVDYAKGNPQNPLTNDDVHKKIWDCMKHGTKRFSKKNVQKLIDSVDRLEEIDDVASIMSLLA